MINKPEPIVSWQRNLSRYAQQIVRQVTLDYYADHRDHLGSSRVLHALRNKQKGGEKI